MRIKGRNKAWGTGRRLKVQIGSKVERVGDERGMDTFSPTRWCLLGTAFLLLEHQLFCRGSYLRVRAGSRAH